MTALYRDFLTREELDAAYDNTRAVADSARILVGFEARSRLLAERYPGELNLRFGPRERQRIDFFRAGSPGAPLLVFIHGGYWQMRRKETFRFLAAGALHHGISVALSGYTLAPEQNLAGIVTEIRDALRWLREHADSLGFDRSRIVVAGWSAGGHLAAMAADEPGVTGVLAISGIFDLEPIRLCCLNDKLLLKPEEVAGLSPLRLPLSEKPLFAVCGSDELPELQRQSWDFARHRAAAKLPGGAFTLAGRNHFTILEELETPGGMITILLRMLLPEL
ncbi:alpha/beta hydrolase [uncultured Victivallis sp.]|uniref:alpha/beta hydrolase n=1 Tax=uncultured Victivallis sp. TaxID=354118 RepID=UPI0025E5617F|nr:alpha/beta hydrolase [uncultured Victivallis sp.]